MITKTFKFFAPVLFAASLAIGGCASANSGIEADENVAENSEAAAAADAPHGPRGMHGHPLLAAALKEIDLSAEQRELALETLRAGSAEAQARRPAGWTVMNESMSLLGGAHASVLEDMGEFMGDDAAMGDSQEFHRRLVESKRAVMETNLSRLASVLTPGQLAQYRATLEARASFMEQVTPPKFERR